MEEPPALLGTFSHDPLPDSTTHIRLLEILNGSFNHHVSCRISHWDIADSPDYYALSYTWGDAASLATIWINGRAMLVRRNCEYVLQQAFSSQLSRYFWVDAVCIDQSSTLEKNHQVALMGAIYKRASHVLACIGQLGNDDEFLFHMLDTKRGLLSSIHAHLRPSDTSNSSWTIENPIPSSTWLTMRCFFSINASDRMRLIAAFISFIQRPYFSRVWVLQELHLASEVSYCCGDNIRSFDSLLALSMLIDFWLQTHDNLSPGILRITSCLLIRFKLGPGRCQVKTIQPFCFQFKATRPQRGCLALASGSRGLRRLADVLGAMKDFNCTDVRDKLYGVLSLIDWRPMSAPNPDYGMDSFELARDVLSLFLKYPHAAPLEGSRWDWTQSLAELFGVSDSEEAFQRAAKERRVATVKQGDITTKTSDPVIPDKGWRGIRILSRSTTRPSSRRRSRPGSIHSSFLGEGTRPASASIHSVSPSRSPDYHNMNNLYIRHPRDALMNGLAFELEDSAGALWGHCPLATRTGDWLLLRVASFSRDDDLIGIIASSSNPVRPRKCNLVGEMRFAAPINELLRNRHEPELQHINVHWDAEDLLLLRVQFGLRPSGYDLEAFKEWPNFGICSIPGSSYAITMQPPRLRGFFSKTGMTSSYRSSKADAFEVGMHQAELATDSSDSEDENTALLVSMNTTPKMGHLHDLCEDDAKDPDSNNHHLGLEGGSSKRSYRSAKARERLEARLNKNKKMLGQVP